MADDIREIFASVKKEAKDFSTALWQCCEKIYNELPQDYEADIDPELQITFLTNKLNQAIETLCDGLDNPTLILATTGTTSSGKSTLVNLLCGAELMPRAVQEMSAGVVTVEYSEQKAVKIEETAGATWECGTWHNVSNEDIYDRLDGVMSAYLKHRAAGDSSVACPRSTVYYPFRLVAEPGLLDLPEGTTVKIMDLPGLAHVGDEGNAEVIKRSQEALCLVTYNSAETDKAKVASLLQEVVDQVKELKGSPARMLFVLNRIDVFRSDKDWPKSEEAFFDKTVQGIRLKLKESLEEYSEEIDKLEIVKLSSLPALLALKMINGNDAEKIEAAADLDSHFNFLMSEDVLDDLPRNVKNWTDHDRKRLYDGIWKEANAEAFHQHLKQHIQNEYPQLILPQIIKSFTDNEVAALVRWASNTTGAVVKSSEDEYELECARIKDIRAKLEQSIQTRAKALRDPFDAIQRAFRDRLNGKEDGTSDSKNPLTELAATLEDTIGSLEENDCFDKQVADRLKPLYLWNRELAKTIKGITDRIINALEDGKSISLSGEKAFEYAAIGDVSLLEGLIRDLAKESYSAYAGKKMQARTPVEKDKLSTLNKKLNDLSYVLKRIVDDVARRVIDREMGRVKGAIECLFAFHLKSLEEISTDIAPDLVINFPQTKLIELTFTAKPKFLFEGGFPVIQESYTETVTKKTGTRRVYFFFKKDTYVTKVEKRSSDNADIPSLHELEEGWKFQEKRGEIEAVNEILTWWVEQFDQFNKGVEEFQFNIIDEYKARLDHAHEDNQIDLDSKVQIWQPLKEEAELLVSQASQLGSEWKSK